MNKDELCQHMVRHFASRSHTDDGQQLHRINRRVAREFLEELSRLCIRELRTRGKFSIPHVGKLVMAPRRPRRGRDPVTGNPIVIPGRACGPGADLGPGPRRGRGAVVRRAGEASTKGQTHANGPATGRGRAGGLLGALARLSSDVRRGRTSCTHPGAGSAPQREPRRRAVSLLVSGGEELVRKTRLLNGGVDRGSDRGDVQLAGARLGGGAECGGSRNRLAGRAGAGNVAARRTRPRARHDGVRGRGPRALARGDGPAARRLHGGDGRRRLARAAADGHGVPGPGRRALDRRASRARARSTCRTSSGPSSRRSTSTCSRSPTHRRSSARRCSATWPPTIRWCW